VEQDAAENEQLVALLRTEAYRENEPRMKTTYERGIERGIEQRERRSATRLMEAKSDPLSAKIRQQIEALSPEDLARLQIQLLNAQSLEELRLAD
jgi:hypothetical protein